MDYYGLMTVSRQLQRLLLPVALAGFGLLLAPPGRAAEAEKPPPQSALDSALFYQTLVGEMSAQAGDAGSAFQLILDAARRTGSAELFERAVQLALGNRAGDSALQAAQAWGRALPTSRDALRYHLQILIGLNKLPETVDVIRRDLALVPAKDRAGALLQLPRYFARASDKKAAATVVEQALATELASPLNGPAAWTAVGTLRLVAADSAGALAAAAKGAAINPALPEPAQLALALMKPENPGAEAIVRTYLAGQPQDEVRMAYVRKLLEADRLADAGAELATLTRQHPAYADGWLVRGSLQVQEKQWKPAEESLKRYLSLQTTAPQGQPAREVPEGTDRGEVQAYFLLSLIAEQEGRYGEAVAYLQKITSPQDRVRVQLRHAGLLAKQGQLAEARAMVRALPQNRAEDARTKLNAEVQILRDAKEYQATFDLLGAAITREPSDVELLYEYAMAAEKINRLQDMERALRQVIALKPDYHHAYNALGYSLADRGLRLDEARQLVQKALEFAPDDPYIVDSLAWVEFRSGNRQEALRLLQKAFKAKPDAEIAAHLGEVLWVLNQRDEAASVWKQGLALNPQNDTLLETMRRLQKQ